MHTMSMRSSCQATTSSIHSHRRSSSSLLLQQRSRALLVKASVHHNHQNSPVHSTRDVASQDAGMLNQLWLMYVLHALSAMMADVFHKMQAFRSNRRGRTMRQAPPSQLPPPSCCSRQATWQLLPPWFCHHLGLLWQRAERAEAPCSGACVGRWDGRQLNAHTSSTHTRHAASRLQREAERVVHCNQPLTTPLSWLALPHAHTNQPTNTRLPASDVPEVFQAQQTMFEAWSIVGELFEIV